MLSIKRCTHRDFRLYCVCSFYITNIDTLLMYQVARYLTAANYVHILPVVCIYFIKGGVKKGLEHSCFEEYDRSVLRSSSDDVSNADL